MIPPHLFYQIYLSFLEQNDCTPPRCGELSDYTDSAHTQVEDPSLGCMNVSNVMTDAGTTQDNFILSAPPVGGILLQSKPKETRFKENAI